MKFKHCISCGWYLPLFMFAKDRRKFQLPVAMGKLRSCRCCTWKQSANNNKVVRYNFETNNFDIKILTLRERIKEFMRR